jgi:hypothetical protein
LKFCCKKALSALMSDERTRVVLPATGAPPGFDVNGVIGLVSFCFSKLWKKKILFFTIGPPAHSPVVVVLKVPGL